MMAVRKPLDLLRPSADPFHSESGPVQQRRRLVVIATSLIGTVLLAVTIRQPQDADAFYPLAATLAAVWFTGALLSGPLHLGSRDNRRPILGPVLLAVGVFLFFVLGALIVRQIPTLHHALTTVLGRADSQPRWVVLLVAVGNAVAEEVFFRGAVYSSFGPHHPARWSTVVYLAVTAAAGNVTLVIAAAIMGTLFAIERRATRGVLASTITHIVWSVLMITVLPR
jgi:uncharacterized protein